MTDHAEILSLLHKHAPGMVPTITDRHALHKLHACKPEGFSWCFADSGTCHFFAIDDSAHAHIELAGLGAVREWCRNRRRIFVLDDVQRGKGLTSDTELVSISDVYLDPQSIGTGPTLSAAILAALRGIFGEKE